MALEGWARAGALPTHLWNAHTDADDGGDTIYVTLRARTIRVCSRCPERARCKCDADLQRFDTDVDTTDPRVAVIVALVGDALHEALEHVTLGGERVVDPHEIEGEMLASVMHVHLASILNRYLAGESMVHSVNTISRVVGPPS